MSPAKTETTDRSLSPATKIANGKDRQSSRRRWMPAMAVALALTPFLLMEFSLRLFAPAAEESVDRDPFVDLHQLRPLFVLNHDTDRWSIPKERWNFFRPDSFAANKRPGTVRIFVLGGSTVQGRPYATETAFSTWLRLRLQAASPETNFEVVNCGGVSYASYRVTKVFDEVLGHQPDAIVLYTGHNEFLEDREYAEVREMGPLRQVAARATSHVRIITWLQSLFQSPVHKTRVMSGEVDARLDHSGGLQAYHRDASWRSRVEQHFGQTLRRMVGSAGRARVPLIVCVPESELVETPPFKIERVSGMSPSQTKKWDDAWQIAVKEDASFAERRSACETCLEIDPLDAGANYVLGRLLYQRGEVDEAIVFLHAARDHDVCPLRATTSIIQTTIEVANLAGLLIVDTPRLLDQRDRDGNRNPDGVPDPAFFVDHLHPTLHGHQRIGDAVASQIETLGLVTATPDAESRYQSLVAKHLATLGEDYYARGRQRLEGLRLWASGNARHGPDRQSGPE